uniref:GH18 domain-containing protein n=1 Tax=Timema tahoe TaxID=61484 RepID=A0A7R9IP60_9NEOP|nr:unnamed protein product [Timema tahoe]
MGFFGTAFTLKNVSDNGVGAPALGPAARTRGSLRYNQICESQMKHRNWNINWDDEAKVPFANLEELCVGYDDPESITYKARYVREMKLGGAMVWSLDMDDFRGTCSDKNLLLQKINDYIS